METVLKSFFIDNWQRKVVAFFIAIIVWVFINNSIIDTKTITNIPIRVVNLPPDTTISGLLSNGVLSKRINLTLSGTKDVIHELESGDLEVHLDASTANHSEWIVNITKKNLISLNPTIDLSQHITAIHHPEFVIKLSSLITAKVPINILPPIGDPPAGYEYLDFWPQRLTQTISGPEEEIQLIKVKGLDICFDLNEIDKEDLEKNKRSQGSFHDDEIRYIVPQKWKQICIPLQIPMMEEINDPEAQDLRIYFLRKQLLPLNREIPLAIFYPLQTSKTLNPATCQISEGKYVKIHDHIPVLSLPLYVKDISKLFLSIIRDNLQIIFMAAPSKEREFLEWSLDIINAKELEDTYVAYLITNLSKNKENFHALSKRREGLIRKRFKEYRNRLKLYVNPDQKLNLEAILHEGKISIIGD